MSQIVQTMLDQIVEAPTFEETVNETNNQGGSSTGQFNQ